MENRVLALGHEVACSICSNGTCLVRISDLFRPNDELTHSIQQDAVFLVIFYDGWLSW